MSGNRAAFSLVTCFSTAWMQEVEQRRSSCRGGAKESNSPSGARTRFKKHRDSDSLLFFRRTKSECVTSDT